MSGNLFRSWIKNLGQNLRGRGTRRSRRLQAAGQDVTKTRPTLETLEARVVPAPVIITPSCSPLLTTATTPLIINGSGFDSNTPTDNVVTFNNGLTGSVTNATSTSLTVALTGLSSVTAVTALYASVTVDGTNVSSSAQVATEANAVLNVTSATGTGAGTLPGAVASAGSGDLITFASSLSGATITLTSTLVLNYSVAITGLGSANLAVSGNYSYEVFDVQPGVTAAISCLTIQDGLASSGGGVNNSGTLTLTNDTVNGNSSYDSGGGIYNSGTLTVNASTISNNTANISGGSSGGGILNHGVLTLSNSTISNNKAVYGGGLENGYGGNATITGCAFTSNSGSSGAGVNNYGGNSITLSNSTIAYNHGNGLWNSGTSLILINCTVAFNSGNGVYNPTLMQNTIVAGNNGDVNQGNDSGNNLIGNTTGLSTTLAYNGGPTQNLALLPGSPAIAAGAAITNVTAPIGQNDTTIYVQNAAAIALTPGDYTINIDSEEMLVTNVDLGNNSLTVERGYNGTMAETHDDNADVYLATDQRGYQTTVPPNIGAYTAPPLIVTDPGSGPGSATDVTLPYAVANAYDFIEFAPSLSGDTITLTSTLTLNGSLYISGLGAFNLAVSENNGMPVFSIPSGVTATLAGLTIENGKNASGGGVVNNGTLTLSGDLITNNSAVLGGGIYNTGALTLTDSIVALNTASGSGNGIYSDSAVALTISATANTTIIDNIVCQGSGGLVLTGSGSIDIPGDINLGTQGSLTDTASGVDTINGVISGTATLTESGPGTLILTSANDYTGATTINGGTLIVTADGAMGPATDPGITVNSGGALGFAGGVDYTTAEPLLVYGSGPGGTGAIVNISGDNTYSLPLNLPIPVTIGSDDGTLTLSGNITAPPPGSSSDLVDGDFTTPAQGPGGYTYDPTGSAWTFTGGGVLQENGSAWGYPTTPGGSQSASLQNGGSGETSASISQTFTWPVGTATISFYLCQRPGYGILPVSVQVNGVTIDTVSDPASNWTLYTTTFTTDGGSNTLTFSATGFTSVDSDTGLWGVSVDVLGGSLTKVGPGAVILSNDNSGLLCTTTIDAGTLIATANGAMGPANAGGIVVNSGGALAFSGGIDYTTAEPITIAGSGPAGNGAIENISGSNTFAGAISLSAASTVAVTTGTTLTLGGTISGTGGLIVGGGSNSGTLVLSGNSTYIGTTTLDSGTLEVDGSIADSSAVTVSNGTTLDGVGTVGATTVDGTLLPSTSLTIGTISTGNLSFGSGGLLDINLNSTTTDAVTVTGTATLTNANLVLSALNSIPLNTSFTILTASGGLGDTTFNTLPNDGTFSDASGQLFEISYTSTTVVVTRIAPPIVTPALFAASYFDGALYEFNATTGALAATLISPYSSSILSGPAGVTLGPDGNLYISNEGYLTTITDGETQIIPDSILEYNLSTGVLSPFIPSTLLDEIASQVGASVFSPAGLTFGPDGNLYVSLSGGYASAIFAAPAGGVVEFGITNNDGTLTFNGNYYILANSSEVLDPTGLTFGPGADNTDLYVCSPGTGSIVKISNATSLSSSTVSTFISFDQNSSAADYVSYPASLTWGPGGNAYVVDLGASSYQGNVVEFNADGSFNSVYTSEDYTNPGDLLYQFPSDAIFNSAGQMYTANLGPAYPPDLYGSINLYNSDGSYDTTLVSSGEQIASTGPETSGISPSQIVLNVTTTTTVESTPTSPITPTTPIYFTATVSDNEDIGTVTIYAGPGLTNQIGSPVDVVDGQATSASTTLGGGYYTITAVYSGVGGITGSEGTESLTVNAPPAFTGTNTATVVVGIPIDQAVTATGTPAPTFSEVGALPAGVTLLSSGAFSGTPTQLGTFQIVVTAANGIGSNATEDYTLTVDPGLFAASYFDGALYDFDANTGALAATLVAPYSSTVLSGPAGLTIGPDGNLYISNEGYISEGQYGEMNVIPDSILEYNRTTGMLTPFIPSTVLDSIAGQVGASVFSPAGLTFGPDGNLYVSLSGGYASAIFENPTGAVVEFGITNDDGTLTYNGNYNILAAGDVIDPTGLTFGPGPGNTNLYVCSPGTGSIVKISNATSLSSSTVSTFISFDQTSTDADYVNYPASLTWGPGGNAYVVDLGAGSYQGNVLVFNADGTFNSVYTSEDYTNPGDLLYQFPSDAIFNSAGQMYTANLGAGYPPNLYGSINLYNSDGSYDTTFVSYQQFPNTGPETSGISPSQIVLDPTTTTTTVASTSTSPISSSTPISFTATVADYTDVGTVTFYAGPGLTNEIGSPVAVVGGVATSSPTTLAAGTDTITAVYSGGIGFASSEGTETVGVGTTSTFSVAGVTATPDGVVLTFNAPINPSTTVLYSSPGDTTLGAADVTVVGASTGAVRGSLVIDATDPFVATFVQTSGLLVPDAYTVTVTNAVQAVGGYTLSGNYSTTFTVASTSAPVLSVPSFARGPGQSVALMDSFGQSTGIPVDISNATGVTQASFSLTYNPTLLTIAPTGALSLSTAATTAGLTTLSYGITNVDPNHSILTVTLSGGTGLTATTAETLVTIQASVPDSAPYLDKAVLNLSGVMVNSANATGVSSVSVVAYPGDVLGTGVPNATDASLIDQVGSGSGSGFSEFKDLDPVIIGIGGTGSGLFLNANDASLIDEAASGATISQIPSIPVGVSLTFGGPDPYLYLSAVQGSPGQTVTETLYLDVTDPNGIQLTALDEAIAFDAGALQISDVRGTSALMALGSYETASTVDNGSGEFLVAQAFMGTGLPPVVPYGTDIPVLQFNVTLNADMGVGSQTGLTLLQDGTVDNVTQYTAISDNEGALTWTPGKAPSNSGNAAVDGSVTVVSLADATTAESVLAATQRSVAVQPKVIVPVRMVAPVSQPMSDPAPATNLHPAGLLVSGVSLAEDTTVVTSVSPQLPAAAEAGVVAAPATASVSESLPGVTIVNVAPSAGKVADPGASLSLAAVGTNRGGSLASTGTSSAKPATSVLDEMYRQLGTMLNGAQVNSYNLTGGDDATDALADMWDFESVLADMDTANQGRND